VLAGPVSAGAVLSAAAASFFFVRENTAPPRSASGLLPAPLFWRGAYLPDMGQA
jgi:hypothetical protein